MRDLDIFVCWNEEITEIIACKLGKQLESREIGSFSRLDVRPRRRANPRLSLPDAFNYNAGFGFFMLDDMGSILDLSIFSFLQRYAP